MRKVLYSLLLAGTVLAGFSLCPQDAFAKQGKKVSHSVASGVKQYDSADRSETSMIADPIEPVNRAVFSFNNFVIDYVFSPVVDAYRFVMPEFVRNGVHNFVWNLKSPVIFANEILQGDVENADVVFRRFFVNSTAGLGGLIDVAGSHGLNAPLPEDMGQTFAKWGAKNGFYIVLPLLGPSSLRDASGEVADNFIDPFNRWAVNTDRKHLTYYRSGLRGLDWADQNIDNYQDMVSNSVDPYVTVRSAYVQFRQRMINDGKTDASAYDSYVEDDMQ